MRDRQIDRLGDRDREIQRNTKRQREVRLLKRDSKAERNFVPYVSKSIFSVNLSFSFDIFLMEIYILYFHPLLSPVSQFCFG